MDKKTIDMEPNRRTDQRRPTTPTKITKSNSNALLTYSSGLTYRRVSSSHCVKTSDSKDRDRSATYDQEDATDYEEQIMLTNRRYYSKISFFRSSKGKKASKCIHPTDI